MTSDVLVDVNVVFAAMLDRHPARARASAFIHEHVGRLRYALPIQLGVLRLLSTPAAMGGSVLQPAKALAVWNGFVAAARMREVVAPMELPGRLEALVKSRQPSPNLWTDAWLAALAIALDFEVATFDRGFRSFEGVRVVLLTA